MVDSSKNNSKSNDHAQVSNTNKQSETTSIPWWKNMLFWLKGNKIGVLGMQGSGKTQLYCSLRGVEYSSDGGTTRTTTDRFSFEIDGKEYFISKGEDIGGTESFILVYYAKWIAEKDIIIMVFDAKKYREDETYKKDTNARLCFIWEALKKKYQKKDESKTEENIQHHFLLIGSHRDMLRPGEEETYCRDEYDKLVQNGKPYSKMFLGNFVLADLRDSQEVRENMKVILK